MITVGEFRKLAAKLHPSVKVYLKGEDDNITNPGQVASLLEWYDGVKGFEWVVNEPVDSLLIEYDGSDGIKSLHDFTQALGDTIDDEVVMFVHFDEDSDNGVYYVVPVSHVSRGSDGELFLHHIVLK